MFELIQGDCLEEMAKLEARALKSEGARRDERNTQVTTSLED